LRRHSMEMSTRDTLTDLQQRLDRIGVRL
jgi:hypothetical protein